MSDGRRSKRVAARVRAQLSQALSVELGDPRLHQVVITNVEVPNDLSVARVSVRLLVGDEDSARRRAALVSLRRVSGRLRRLLGPELGLRKVPELRFEYDRGPDAARRVEELLAEIREEGRLPEE